MKRGNIVTNKGSGQSYVVIDDERGRIVAARIIEISNPSEWEKSALPPTSIAIELEEVRGDLRQLASWVDSALSGNSFEVEAGSSIYGILQRWK